MLDSNELYKKWIKSIFFLAVSFVFFIIVGELLNYKYSSTNYYEDMAFKNYFIAKILTPALFNSIVIIVGYNISKIKKIPIAKKGVIPIIVITLISFCFIYFHNSSSLCIMSLAIPIILSILYSDNKLAKQTAIICGIVSFAITSFLLNYNYSLGYGYIVNLCSSLVFIFAFTTTAYIMSDLEGKKNELLSNSIKERNLYHKKAIIDELTKCYNRTSYEETIKKRFKKYKKIVLAIMDLDHFKDVNDTYGHLVGDIVLKRFGKFLNMQSSDEIYVARYGGEEFVVLFFDHTIEQVNRKITKLHKKFSEIEFKELDNKQITFSCGVAPKKQDDTPVSLFEKADNALYEAKDTGRNKIVIYKQ